MADASSSTASEEGAPETHSSAEDANTDSEFGPNAAGDAYWELECRWWFGVMFFLAGVVGLVLVIATSSVFVHGSARPGGYELCVLVWVSIGALCICVAFGAVAPLAFCRRAYPYPWCTHACERIIVLRAASGMKLHKGRLARHECFLCVQVSWATLALSLLTAAALGAFCMLSAFDCTCVCTLAMNKHAPCR